MWLSMISIKVTLPDGSVREYPAGVSMLEIAKDISPRLAREALAAKVDGRLVNRARPWTGTPGLKS